MFNEQKLFMLEKLLTCYVYPDKPALLKIADTILYPLRAFDGRTIEFDPQKDTIRVEDTKTESLFKKSFVLQSLFLSSRSLL